MHSFLLNLHNVLFWAVMIFGLTAIVLGLSGWSASRPWKKVDNQVSLILLISCHLQFVIGLVMYFFTSGITKMAFQDFGAAMKNPDLRFFAVEHILVMILGIVLITIGRSRSKKAVNAVVKHKNAAIFYTLGMLFILSRVPWDRLF